MPRASANPLHAPEPLPQADDELLGHRSSILMSVGVADDGVDAPPVRTARGPLPHLRPELALLVAGVLPSLVVYGLHWRRGYFLDDPFMDALSLRELMDSVGDMRARPLGTVLVAITYLIGEPAGRALAGIVLAATATLAALLVRRTCGGRYAPIITALLVVYPVLDWESALYWYAAIQYPAGAAFGLAAGHAFLTTLRAKSRRSAVLSGAGCVALYAGGFACTEVALNFVLLVPGLAAVEALRRKRFGWQAATRSAAVTAGAAAVLGALGAIIYLPKSDFTSARGELLLDPLDAARRLVRVWIPSLREAAFSSRRARIHREAFSMGLENLTGPIVLAVFVAALLTGAYALRAVLRSPADPRRPKDRRPAVALIGVGLGLFLISSWFPAALLSGQGPVTRLLFTPWVALVLTAGAAVAGLEASGATRTVRAAVVLAMGAVVLLALTIDGYGELFRLRDARNDEQLAGWLGILEDSEPHPPDLRIASLYGSDRLLQRPSPTDDTLAGLTETPWALSRAVFERRREGVFAIGGHPFVPVCIERMPDSTQLRLTSLFNDEIVRTDALIATEVQGPRLLVVNEIVFGATTVKLPLADRVMSPAYGHIRLQSDGDKVCHSYGRSVP